MSDQTQELTEQQIWAQLEAEETGKPAPDPDPEPAAAPATTEAASPATTEAAPAAATEPQADDPLAGVPQVLRDEIAGLRASNAQLQHQVRQAHGKLGELNALVRQSVQAAQHVRSAGGDAPSAGEIAAAQGSAKKFEKLREEYPDFSEAIDEFVSAKVGQSVDAQQVDSLQQQLAQERAERELLARKTQVEIRHPGWEREIVTPAFGGWLERQLPEIRMLADSNEPAAAIRVLDLYKQERARAPSLNHDLHSAAAIQGGRRSTPRQKPVEEMTAEEYWDYLEAQDRAAASAGGRK